MAPLARAWGRLAALVGILVLGFVLARITGLDQLFHDPAARAHAVNTLHGAAGIWWVGPAFALGYGLSVGVGLPGLIPTLLGGAAFGFFPGIVWVTIGANLGANLAFWLARRLGRGALEGFFGSRLGAFDRYSDTAGFQGLLVLRLLPIAPFTLLNFAAGLTTISWPDYALATVIGILPAGCVYVFFADALLSGTAEASHAALIRALAAGLVLVAFSLLTRWIIKRRSVSSPSSSPP